MALADTTPRQLPAGDDRNLPILDALARELNAAGENVHVVYSYRGDLFKVVPVGKPDQVQYRTDLGEAA